MVVEDYIISPVDDVTRKIIPFRKRCSNEDEIECLVDEPEEYEIVNQQEEYEFPDIDYDFVSDCIIRDCTKQEIVEYMLDLIKFKYNLKSTEEAVDNWGRFKSEFLSGLERK